MVGIITLSNSTHFNYGGILQNYALTIFLNEISEAEAIHCDASSILGYLKVVLLKKLGILIEPAKRKVTLLNKHQMNRSAAFQHFIDEEIAPRKYPFYTNKIYRQIDNRYSMFVVGSDQVWNPYMTMSKQGVTKYFLKFTDRKKRMSYAASFGISEIPEKYVSMYKEGLSGFEHISVRESSAVDIISNLTGQNAIHVIDPVFLLSSEQWEKIAQKGKKYTNDKYILRYFLGENNELYETKIRSIAKKKNLKIIDLFDTASTVCETGPKEFVRLIKESELVITDSFHATAFSIIFEKQFIALKRVRLDGQDMWTRISSLLEMFEIDENLVSGESIEEIDYKNRNTSGIIQQKREEAMAFLLPAMSNMNQKN